VLQHRWPIGFTVIASIVLAIGALFVWTALSGLSVPANCFLDRFLEPMPAECIGTEEFLALNEDIAGKVMAAMFVLPLLTGLLVGAPLVASELESRTATIAWSLGGSRRRWLVARLAILAGGLVIALAIPAMAADILVASRPPHYDLSSATMVDYGLRGPLVVFRGLASFSIGVAAGLLLGRLLPAILVGGVAVLLLVMGVTSYAYADWPESELFVPRADQNYADRSQQDYGWIDASGVRISWEQLIARYPGGFDETDPNFDYTAFEAWQYDNFQRVVLGIPGEKLAFVPWREAAGLTALSIVLLGSSLWFIEGRRPT
jgi:hypothetical protein